MISDSPFYNCFVMKMISILIAFSLCINFNKAYSTTYHKPIGQNMKLGSNSYNHELNNEKYHQYFLDTADKKAWDTYMKFGIFYGITTNPLLLERAGIRCDIGVLDKLANEALDKHNVNCFMLQTWGGSAKSMVENGIRLSKISRQIVVKVPLISEGIEAAAELRKNGVRLCMTACYAKNQVFTSIGLDAEYVAPYVGRMIDSGIDGLNELHEMQNIVTGLRSKTRVFAASIRDLNQLTNLAAKGIHTFTFSTNIADMLLHNHLSVSAAKEFEDAVQSTINRI